MLWSYRKICVNILSWRGILILGEGDVCCLLYEYKTVLDIMLLTLKCIVYFMFLSDVFFVHYKKRSFMLKGVWRSQILIFFQDIQQSNFYIPIEYFCGISKYTLQICGFYLNFPRGSLFLYQPCRFKMGFPIFVQHPCLWFAYKMTTYHNWVAIQPLLQTIDISLRDSAMKSIDLQHCNDFYNMP